MVEKHFKKRIAKGEPAAIVELYDQHGEALLKYLTSRVGPTNAKDVLQNVFTRLFRYHRKLAKAENLVAYIFMTARNEAIRFQHSENRRTSRAQSLDQAQTIIDPAPSIESSVQDKETVAMMLGKLEETDKEIVQLKIFSGLTFKEVAKIMAMPEQTVASKYRRSIEKLKRVEKAEKPIGFEAVKANMKTKNEVRNGN